MLFVRILLRDEPIKPGPGHVPVDPHGVLGHGSVSWFPIAVLSFWRMKKPYAGRGAMPFTSSLKTKVRKQSDVIMVRVCRHDHNASDRQSSGNPISVAGISG